VFLNFLIPSIPYWLSYVSRVILHSDKQKDT
jgi:hypothetical protein